MLARPSLSAEWKSEQSFGRTGKVVFTALSQRVGLYTEHHSGVVDKRHIGFLAFAAGVSEEKLAVIEPLENEVQAHEPKAKVTRLSSAA